mgnify:CR=1 FL=1
MPAFFRRLTLCCASFRRCAGVIPAAALAPLLWLGMVSPAMSESIAASASDRRAQAPAIAVTRDGSIHAIWFDKGAVGEADKKGEKVKLRVSFLPFIMGPHTAHLSFEDHRFGKFVYELAGGAEHPQPMSEHKAEVDIKPQMSNIVVSFINNPLELAKRTFLEKHPLAKVKEGDYVIHLASMPIADAGMTNMLKLSRV